MNAAAFIALGLILVVLVAHYIEARAARRVQQTIAARLTDLAPHDRQTEIMPPPMEQELRARAAEEPAPHRRPHTAEPFTPEPPPTRRVTRSPILPPALAPTAPSSPPKAPTFGPPPPSVPMPPSAGARPRTQRPPAPELPPRTVRRPGAAEAPPDSARTLLGWPAPPQRVEAPGSQ